jgi:hypothetical protein
VRDLLRALLIVVQFDLRGAEQAREGMHNSLVNGRPVSLLSLDRDDY